MKIKHVLFLDMDNTLIETKSGRRFPSDEKDWKFKKDIIQCIKEYCVLKSITDIFIVTNQGGIQSKLVHPEKIKVKIDHVASSLQKEIIYDHTVWLPNVPIVHWYYCGDMKSEWRKPNTAYIDYLLEVYPDLRLSKSTMIGDASGKPESFSDSDLNFAKYNYIPIYYDVESFINR